MVIIKLMLSHLNRKKFKKSDSTWIPTQIYKHPTFIPAGVCSWFCMTSMKKAENNDGLQQQISLDSL
jgi:hypothetical protein